MQLKELLFGVSIDAVLGSTSVSIEGVTSDSRALGTNSLFVAISGEYHDGHDHISDAVKKGAVAVLCEELPKKQKDGVTYVQAPQSRSAYAVVASNYQNNPSSKLNLIGDGEEQREYIHAADAAKLSVDILENEEYKNKHIILTGTQKVKRIDLFNMVSEILGDDITIKLLKSEKTGHYKYTPYSFQPSISQKLLPNPQIDLGQGILECIRNVHQKN